MKQKCYIAGIGMTPFGKHLQRSLKSLAHEAVLSALRDANLSPSDLGAAWVGNVGAGVISGQVCVLGQVVLRDIGVGGIPIINVENACASSATAFQQACSMVSLGAHDVALVLGVEKLYAEDKSKTFSVFAGGVDIERQHELLEEKKHRREALSTNIGDTEIQEPRSLFIDIYAEWALDHMRNYGTSRAQLAAVSAKNSLHGSLNSLAQYRSQMTIDEVLLAKEILWPLTLPMCSPIGDGAAALIVVSEKKARQLGMKDMVKVEACELRSGHDFSSEADIEPARLAANHIYEVSGIGPRDLDVIELHDASAISEILYYEHLGLCNKGEGGILVESGSTTLGGAIPVNTSGGLMRKGHPVGATGAAQLVELCCQLRGIAGKRQVDKARTALAENGGGYIGSDVAALAFTILSK